MKNLNIGRRANFRDKLIQSLFVTSGSCDFAAIIISGHALYVTADRTRASGLDSNPSVNRAIMPSHQWKKPKEHKGMKRLRAC